MGDLLIRPRRTPARVQLMDDPGPLGGSGSTAGGMCPSR